MRALVAPLITTLITVLLAGCATPLPKALQNSDHPLVGRIWQPATQSFVSALNARRQIINADYVLLGEKHDNSTHHELQTAAVHDLITAGRKPLIAFEMIDRGQTKTLMAYLAGQPTSADDLGTALDWDKTGWPDWRYYAPIATAAIKAGLPLAPANFPRAKVRELGRKGYAALDAAFVARLGLETPLPDALNAALMEEMFQSHCGMMPRKHLSAVVRIQRARDAVMAETLAKKDRAVLIAGGGHTRNDRGVPYYLRRLKPGTTILSVGYVEVDATASKPEDYVANSGAVAGTARLPFDLVWFTPRLDNEDPCKKFAPQLKKMKKKAG